MSEPHPYCTEHDQPLDWCAHYRLQQEPGSLLEALGIEPGSDADNGRRRELERAFERIREAERAAHLAAAQIWIAGGPAGAGEAQ